MPTSPGIVQAASAKKEINCGIFFPEKEKKKKIKLESRREWFTFVL